MLNRRNLKLAFSLVMLASVLYGFSALTKAAQDGFGTRDTALVAAVNASK